MSDTSERLFAHTVVSLVGLPICTAGNNEMLFSGSDVDAESFARSCGISTDFGTASVGSTEVYGRISNAGTIGRTWNGWCIG